MRLSGAHPTLCTEGIKALKSELANIDSDVSITTDGWTSMTQDSYNTITGKYNMFELTFSSLPSYNDVNGRTIN